jgi:hypothetical protein
MNVSLLPRDSIAQRFALTVSLAVVVTWSLIGLFHVFGGAWAQPSLENSGLLDQAANMVRIIEAAPPPIREQLASAATTREVRVGWYAATSPVSTVLEQAIGKASEHGRAAMERLLGDHHPVVVALKPGGSSDALMSTPEFQEERAKYPHAYVLACLHHAGKALGSALAGSMGNLAGISHGVDRHRVDDRNASAGPSDPEVCRRNTSFRHESSSPANGENRAARAHQRHHIVQ